MTQSQVGILKKKGKNLKYQTSVITKDLLQYPGCSKFRWKDETHLDLPQSYTYEAHQLNGKPFNFVL